MTHKLSVGYKASRAAILSCSDSLLDRNFPNRRGNELAVSPSRSYMVLLLSLMLFAGLVGCGSAPSDQAPTVSVRASVDAPPVSKQSPTLRTDPAASLGNETGAVRASSDSANLGDTAVVPVWAAKELNSPDARIRLRALETWVQSAPPGAVDLLLLAYEDKDERVRARAMELVEQAWAREAEAEK